MSLDVEDFIIGIEIATGKELFEYSLEDDKYAIYASNAITETDGSFQIFGSYLEKEAKTAKENSLGLFCFNVNKEGKVLTRKYQSWKNDMSKILKINDDKQVADMSNIYFHKFLRTADNKIFAVGEQFHPALPGPDPARG